MQNQSQINSSAISGYQEGALLGGKSLVEKERKDLCNIRSIMVHYVVNEVLRTQKLVLSAEDVSKHHVICFANVNISIQ